MQLAIRPPAKAKKDLLLRGAPEEVFTIEAFSLRWIDELAFEFTLSFA